MRNLHAQGCTRTRHCLSVSAKDNDHRRGRTYFRMAPEGTCSSREQTIGSSTGMANAPVSPSVMTSGASRAPSFLLMVMDGYTDRRTKTRKSDGAAHASCLRLKTGVRVQGAPSRMPLRVHHDSGTPELLKIAFFLLTRIATCPYTSVWFYSMHRGPFQPKEVFPCIGSQFSPEW